MASVFDCNLYYKVAGISEVEAVVKTTI